MNTGKFGAYRALQPNKDISNTVIANENQNRLAREEQRLIKDRNKKAQEEALQKQKESASDLEKSLKGMQVGSTGYKSHDEPLVKLLQGDGGLFEQYSQIHDQLQKNPNDYKLISKKIALEKSVDNIKNLQTAFVQRASALQKGIAEGTISPTLNKGYIDNYKKMMDEYQYDYKLDDSGQISIINLGKTDLDGDGLPDEFNLQDIMDPSKLGVIKGKFDYNGWLADVKQNYGTIDRTTDENGFETVRLKGFDPAKTVDLTKDVNTLFGSDLKNITDEGRSFLGDTMGIENINELDDDKFQQIKADFVRKAINSYPKTESNTINYSARNTANNSSIKLKQNEIKTAKEEEEKNSLRKTADGIVEGIPEYVSSLNSTSSNLIRRAKYKNGVIEITDTKINTKGEKQQPTITEIDTSDKKQAALQIASLLRPKDKRDNVVKMYEEAEEPSFNFDRELETQKEVKSLVENWGKNVKADVVFSNLEDLGLKGFEDVSGYISNKIKAPNGKIYNVNQDKGMADFKKYITSKEYLDTLKKQDAPEPDNIPEEKENSTTKITGNAR